MSSDKAPYKAQAVNQEGQPDLGKEAAEFSYVALNQFLDSSYVQKITNYLHDKFCREGLEVKTGKGEDIGRIYGDANMLNAGAQQGVRHSAITAQMAREAIYTLVTEGVEAAMPSSDDIGARFPKKVGEMDLADWNTSLKKECEERLFEEGVKGIASTVAKRVASSLAHGVALTPVEKVLEQAAQEQEAEKPTHDPIF